MLAGRILILILVAATFPALARAQTLEITRELGAPQHFYFNDPPVETIATDALPFPVGANEIFAINDYDFIRLRLVAPAGKKFVCTAPVRLTWPGDIVLTPVGSPNSGMLQPCPATVSFTTLAGTEPASNIQGFKTSGHWLMIRSTANTPSSSGFEFTEIVLQWSVTGFNGSSMLYTMFDAGGWLSGMEIDLYQQLSLGAPDPGPAVFLQDLPVEPPPCTPNSNTWPACGSPVAVRPGPDLAPSLSKDGSGGFYVSYTHADAGTIPDDIWLNRLDANGTPVAGWPANGIPVCQAAENQFSSLVVPDGNGGAIVAWSDQRNDPVDLFNDVYVQRITAAGAVAIGWPVNGVAAHSITPGVEDVLSGLVADGSTGAFVASSGIVRVNRMTGFGTVHPSWPANGLVLGTGTSQLLSDGAGGVYACWRSSTDLRILRLTSLGVVAAGWPANGLVLATGSGPFAMDLTADASHVNVLWGESATGNLRVKRVTPSGGLAPGWSASGVLVSLTPYPKSNLSVSHGGTTGDVVLIWREDLPAPSGFQMWAQRLTPTSARAVGWPESGWQVITDGTPLRAVPDCADGTLLTWTSSGIRAIRFTPSATVAPGWPANGVLLCGGGFSTVVQPVRNWSIPDGTGGVITAVSRIQPGTGDVFDRAEIHAQCVRGDGSFAAGYAGGTGVGSDVTTQVGPARVTFATVTEAGETLVEVGDDGPPPPAGVQIVPSNPPVYYDLTTLADYTGPVEVCITYDPASVQGPESALQLLHYDEDALPPTWVDITTFVDVVGNMICGSTPSLSPFIVVETDPTDVAGQLPGAPRLYANVPNPFNPTTTIRYELSSEEQVRLEILDVSGRLVRTLVHAKRAAGQHEMLWNGHNDAGERVASGVYFYRLRAGSFESTRRMVLMK